MARIPFSKRKRSKNIYLKEGKNLKSFFTYREARKYRRKAENAGFSTGRIWKSLRRPFAWHFYVYHK
jgi:hypothetical protein